jgi:phage replication O-like protein O
MASPQKEDGYTSLANELLEAYARAHLSGGEFRVVLAVLRDSYGWKRKSSRLSLRRLSVDTNMHWVSFLRSLRSLISKGILTEERIGAGVSLSPNKDYDSWKDCWECRENRGGNAQATIGNMEATSGNAQATIGNMEATSGNAQATIGPPAPKHQNVTTSGSLQATRVVTPKLPPYELNQVKPREIKKTSRVAEKRDDGDDPKSAKTLVAYFVDLWTAKEGEKPAAFQGGQLGALLKKQIKEHGYEEVKRRIDNFFASTDWFIVNNTYDVGIFIKKWTALREGPIHGNRGNGQQPAPGSTRPTTASPAIERLIKRG